MGSRSHSGAPTKRKFLEAKIYVTTIYPGSISLFDSPHYFLGNILEPNLEVTYFSSLFLSPDRGMERGTEPGMKQNMKQSQHVKFFSL